MKQDIIVIGGGIIGLATAERLLAQGAAVTILERNKVGQESSWAGGGILSPLCPWDYTDDVNRLTNYSLMLFPAWATALYEATKIDAEFETSGMLVLPAFDKQVAQLWCARHDVRIEEKMITLPFSPACETAKDNHRKTVNALFLRDIAQIRNPRLLHALRNKVLALGGKIIEYCTVHEIKTTQRKVQAVLTSSGMIHAAQYVVAAGAWSQEILGRYALNLSIRPSRGQMLLFKFASPPLRHILLQKNLYLIPRKDGHLLVGSTLEDVGFNKNPTTAARNMLFQRAQQLLPILNNMPIKKHWAGLRPASPQNIPTIGRHPQLNNLFINSGHFRYGVTMAPASAEILLNEIIGAPQPFDMTAYQTGWGFSREPSN